MEPVTDLSQLNDTAYFIIRLITCGIWIGAFLFKITHIQGTYNMIRNVTVWPAWTAVPAFWISAVIEVVGIVLILANIYVWAVAAVWFLFIWLIVPWFHGPTFWKQNGKWVPDEINLMMKNVSHSAGLLLLIVVDIVLNKGAGAPDWLVGLFFN